MAVRTETKTETVTEYVTSSNVRTRDKKYAHRLDVQFLGGKLRYEVTRENAIAARDAINEYLADLDGVSGETPTTVDLPTNRVLKLVASERLRQVELKQFGKFTHTCADNGLHPGQRLAILTEEVGEVARELCDGNPNSLESHRRLKTELVQVAAVAVAWVEFLDRLT